MDDRAWLGPNANKTPIPADQTFQEHLLGVALIARRKYLA